MAEALAVVTKAAINAGLIQDEEGASSWRERVWGTDKDARRYRTLPRPTPSSTVPFRRDPHFIDRKILAEIEGKSQQHVARVALIAPEGVGESHIAIKYSYRVRDKSPDIWVFWVHAGTQARFDESYRRIAETTRMDGWDNPKADILRFVRN
ncbi:hypothetical protein K469DRAFT_697331 [Zopfia rhizophila CBS 207.26]|uniref:Uncharacterized protein n=1 Tax=Zopfia rhizophila CBS 207.26 TaxID=1314779 RepID=A0A6A6DIB0_9PEZI|nr:hypothetical protein K469DRAFT_697331 [Zopfia rhizophila CBS 207.26]